MSPVFFQQNKANVLFREIARLIARNSCSYIAHYRICANTLINAHAVVLSKAMGLNFGLSLYLLTYMVCESINFCDESEHWHKLARAFAVR